MSFGQYILDENGNPEPCEDIIKWGAIEGHLKVMTKVLNKEITNE